MNIGNKVQVIRTMKKGVIVSKRVQKSKHTVFGNISYYSVKFNDNSTMEYEKFELQLLEI